MNGLVFLLDMVASNDYLVNSISIGHNTYRKRNQLLSSSLQPAMDAGIIGSTIGIFTQVIFDKYLSSKLEQWADRANLGGEFQNLCRQFDMAKAILVTLKGSPVMEEGIWQLVWDLKSSSYDAEDVLDELDFFRLMEIVDNRSENKLAASMGLSFPSALQNTFHQPVPNMHY